MGNLLKVGLILWDESLLSSGPTDSNPDNDILPKRTVSNRIIHLDRSKLMQVQGFVLFCFTRNILCFFLSNLWICYFFFFPTWLALFNFNFLKYFCLIVNAFNLGLFCICISWQLLNLLWSVNAAKTYFVPKVDYENTSKVFDWKLLWAGMHDIYSNRIARSLKGSAFL